MMGQGAMMTLPGQRITAPNDALSTALLAHLIVSVIMLLAGAICLRYRLSDPVLKFTKIHPMQKAYLHLFIPDVLLILLFLPSDIFLAWTAPAQTDCSFCHVVVVLAVATIVAEHLGTVWIAFALYRYADPQYRVGQNNSFWMQTAVSWTCGLSVGLFCMMQRVRAPYRQFYCFKQDTDDMWVVLLAALVLALSSSIAIVYLCCKAYSVVQSSAEKCLIVGNTFPTFLQEIKKCGAFLLVANCACWIGFVVISIFEIAEIEHSIWWDVVSSWLIQLSPYFHCIVLKNILKQESGAITPVPFGKSLYTYSPDNYSLDYGTDGSLQTPLDSPVSPHGMSPRPRPNTTNSEFVLHPHTTSPNRSPRTPRSQSPAMHLPLKRVLSTPTRLGLY